jgi:hypothetical protein
MQDIVSSMFGEKFLDEIFRPQELCSRKALRTIFEKLAHTSIMRLNESSMDKVSELIKNNNFILFYDTFVAIKIM